MNDKSSKTYEKQSIWLKSNIIDKMINAFALHRIKVNEKGEPIDYEYIEINRAFESFTGLKKENTIGKTYKELVPGSETENTDWIGIFGKVAITGEPVSFESYTKAFDKWDLDLMSKEYFVSDRCYDLFGYKKTETKTWNIVETWDGFIHPDDVEKAREFRKTFA